MKIATILSAIDIRIGKKRYGVFNEEDMKELSSSSCPFCDQGNMVSRPPSRDSKLSHLLNHLSYHEDVFGGTKEYETFVRKWCKDLFKGGPIGVAKAVKFIEEDGLKKWKGSAGTRVR